MYMLIPFNKDLMVDSAHIVLIQNTHPHLAVYLSNGKILSYMSTPEAQELTMMRLYRYLEDGLDDCPVILPPQYSNWRLL